VNGTGPVARQAAVSAPCPDDRRDPCLSIEPNGASTVPPAGQLGHGSTAVLRRRPVRIVDGRFEGGYIDVFELIFPSCGDHPNLDYSEVPPRLEWLRGPRTLERALAAYDRHLGLPWPD
jgi:hypothetical protein